MKYIKKIKLFEGGDPEKKAKIREKSRDLIKKESDIVSKKSDIVNKIKTEEDPLKGEILTLELQKAELQKLMTRLDQKLNALKYKQEDAK